MFQNREAELISLLIPPQKSELSVLLVFEQRIEKLSFRIIFNIKLNILSRILDLYTAW